ncbi:MAG: hypothetical protein HYX88_03390 [Chloroflexi bacterium]|nr:hypothetical protein [Chloroflexota bacterium]
MATVISRVFDSSHRLIALGCLVAYGLIMLASVAAALGPSSMGLDARPMPDGSWRISWVMPAGLAWDGGVRPGDLLLAIDGVPTENAAPLYPLSQAQGVVVHSQTTGEIRVIAGTEPPVSTRSSARSAVLPVVIPMGILSVIYAVLGLLVYTRIPYGVGAAFGAFAGAIALVFMLAPASLSGQPWAQAGQFLSIVLMAGTFPYFFSIFPRERFWSLRGIRVTPHIYLYSFLAISASYGMNVLWMPTAYPSIRTAFFAYLFLGLLASLALLVHSWITGEMGDRKSLGIVAAGTAVAVAPLALLTSLPQMLGLPYILEPHLSTLAFVLIPISFTYAILRHQLMGIRRLVHRGIVYTLTGVIIFTGLLVALWLITLSFSRYVHLANTDIVVVAVLLAAGCLAFPRIQALVHQLVDRLVYQEVYDPVHAVSTISGVASRAGDESFLAGMVANGAISLLRLESALVLLDLPGRGLATMAAVGEKAVEVSAVANRYLQGMLHTNALGLAEFHHGGDPILYVSFPISDGHQGYLVLGPRRMGEVFLARERGIAISLGSVTAIAFQKYFLSKEVQNKAEQLAQLNKALFQAHEGEYSRLSRAIHDGPLQKASMLAMRLASLPVEPDVRQLAKEITEELRDHSALLHLPILDDLGLGDAVKWLCSRMEKRKMHISLDVSGLQDGKYLNLETETAVYRVVQEALNNCMAHAHASTVSVQIRKDQEDLTLTVEDNGRGFMLPIADPSDGRRHLGVRIMRQRIQELGGHFEITSHIGRGTIVVATVPLSGKEKNGE